MINQGKEEYDIVNKVEEKNKMMDKKEKEYNLIRYVCIVIDISVSSKLNDFKPNRLQMVINTVNEQLQEFIQQNPLS